MTNKPLGRKSYGSIPHLYGSRLGPGDHHCHKGQHDIATVRPRDKHDRVIVSEKVDGSNVSVALVDNTIFALTRSGKLASASVYEQHRLFAEWVSWNEGRFRFVLNKGERICGEWMMQAHSIRYDLGDLEPFFVFDIMTDSNRLPWDEVISRTKNEFQRVPVISDGPPMSAYDAFSIVDKGARPGTFGKCGALEPVEGFVWRVERFGEFNFNAKLVRQDKVDGRYLGDSETVWNITPEQLRKRYA